MTIIKNELDDSVYKCSLMLTTMLKYVCPDAKVSYDTQAQVFLIQFWYLRCCDCP